jgi:hypothetical protein
MALAGVQQVKGGPSYAGVQSKQLDEPVKMLPAASPSGLNYVQWKFHEVREGQYQLVNTGTNQCMDVRGGSVEEKALVVQWPCKDATDSSIDNQLWTWNGTPWNSTQLTNVKSGKMLAHTSWGTGASNSVVQTSKNDALTEWELQP